MTSNDSCLIYVFSSSAAAVVWTDGRGKHAYLYSLFSHFSQGFDYRLPAFFPKHIFEMPSRTTHPIVTGRVGLISGQSQPSLLTCENHDLVFPTRSCNHQITAAAARPNNPKRNDFQIGGEKKKERRENLAGLVVIRWNTHEEERKQVQRVRDGLPLRLRTSSP